MTSKRFVKLLMSVGIERNVAVTYATIVKYLHRKDAERALLALVQQRREYDKLDYNSEGDSYAL